MLVESTTHAANVLVVVDPQFRRIGTLTHS
jgi:hypothetical protein